MSLRDIALEDLEQGVSIEGLKVIRVRGKGWESSPQEVSQRGHLLRTTNTVKFY